MSEPVTGPTDMIGSQCGHPRQPHGASTSLCNPCYQYQLRHPEWVVGAPRQKAGRPIRFPARYLDLVEIGVTNHRLMADRLGMRWGAFERAYYRARQRGELT